jgi:hypothetical protein
MVFVNTPEKLFAPTRTLSKRAAYIVNGSPPDNASTAKRRSLWVIVGGLNRRPLMPDHDPALDDAIREIAALLATAYLRLRFPIGDQRQLDSPQTESPHGTARLTP